VPDSTNDSVEFLVSLARACRDEGIRRARVGDVEIEMAVVKNPIAEAAAKDLQGRAKDRKQGAPDQVQVHGDWEDAFGSSVPVLPVKRG
jgi:hypothetical protein